MHNARREQGEVGDAGRIFADDLMQGVRSPEVLAVMFRHKWKALSTFIFVTTLTAVTVLFFPRSYLSEAKLFVRVGRETAAMDPTATTGQTVTVQASREREVNSILEILRSQVIVDHTVDSIGVETLLEKTSQPTSLAAVLAPLKRLKQRFDNLDPISDRERAALLVRDQLRFDAPDDTDVVTVSAKSGSAERARTLVSHALDSFFEVHARLTRNQRSYEFFENQTELLSSQLTDASAELRDAKNRFGLLTVDGQRALLTEQISGVMARVAKLDGDLAYSRARVGELETMVTSLPAVKVKELTTGIGNPAADQMRAQLFELEIREKELAAKLTDNHPTLIAIRQQRQNAAEIVADQPPQRTHTTSAVDETHQTLQIDWLAEKATLAALGSQHETLEGQQERLGQDLEALNEHAFRITELESRVDLLSASYQTYVERREEARIDEALRREKISSINLVQSPTVSHRPASPRKLAVAAIGLLFAVAGAGMAVIAAEYFDSSFVTPSQIERQLELPVLVSIPRTRRHRRFELS